MSAFFMRYLFNSNRGKLKRSIEKVNTRLHKMDHNKESTSDEKIIFREVSPEMKAQIKAEIKKEKVNDFLISVLAIPIALILSIAIFLVILRLAFQ